MADISDKLLEILVCPKCKARVEPEGNALKCTNPECRLVYPVENGVPVMLIDKAKKPAS